MQNNLKYWYLHEHQLFKNLSFGEIDALCILKKFKKSKKAEIIELPYTEKERIYFLKHGAIKLLKIDQSGEEVLVDVLQKGDIFGELGFDASDSEEHLMRVVSDEAIMCTFYKEKLEEVMLKKPDFAISYIKFMGLSFKRVENSYKNIFFKDAKTRLLLLIEAFMNKEHDLKDSYVLPAYVTQKDLSQLICTSRQTVISLLKELETEGVLKTSERSVTVADVEGFRKMLKGVK